MQGWLQALEHGLSQFATLHNEVERGNLLSRDTVKAEIASHMFKAPQARAGSHHTVPHKPKAATARLVGQAKKVHHDKHRGEMQKLQLQHRRYSKAATAMRLEAGSRQVQGGRQTAVERLQAYEEEVMQDLQRRQEARREGGSQGSSHSSNSSSDASSGSDDDSSSSSSGGGCSSDSSLVPAFRGVSGLPAFRAPDSLKAPDDLTIETLLSRVKVRRAHNCALRCTLGGTLSQAPFY